MREIDYIYQNFDPVAFVKNLKKAKKIYKDAEGFNFLVGIVLDSVRDINQIKNTINLYQFTKISENKTFINFVKKYRNNYSDKDIEKYFFEKMNILNTRDKDTGDIEFLLGIHLECGEFFRHFKKYFEITFYGQVTYTNNTYKNDEEFGIYRDYYCLHIKDINKYYLFFFQHHSRTMEMEFTYVPKIFNKRPNSIELIKIMEKGDKETYPDKKEIRVKQYQIFNYDKSYNRIYSEGYKLKHKTEPHFLNEEDYFNYHNTKGESYIAQEMAISNPEKYFKKCFKGWKQVSSVFGGKVPSSFGGGKRAKIKGKIKDNKFFKFVMSDRFNYRNNKKFIEDIIYSYDDLEGFLEYVPKKIQESKSLKEEIRILKMFTTDNKKYLIKIFNTNKDKLDALAENYMPTTILNDPYLMMKLIKIDTGLMARIGDALRKNKSFMKKVMKFINK